MYHQTVALLILLCSCSQAVKKLDPQSAIGGSDLTTLVSGCGQQVTIGYLVCRMPEGSATNNAIEVHAPPDVKCDDEEGCVYFKIFFPDGRPTYKGSIPKGKNYASVPWSEIIDKQTFDPGDRGFYAIAVTINYKGPNGVPMKTYSDGYIFLHIVKREYVSLSDSEGKKFQCDITPMIQFAHFAKRSSRLLTQGLQIGFVKLSSSFQTCISHGPIEAKKIRTKCSLMERAELSSHFLNTMLNVKRNLARKHWMYSS